jgi:hypothetical protein
MWARTAWAAIILSAAVVSGMVAKLHDHPRGVLREQANNHLNTKFGPASRRIWEDVVVFCPTPNVGENTFLNQRDCLISSEREYDSRGLSARWDNCNAFASGVPQIRERKVGLDWRRQVGPANPHFEVLRGSSTTIFPNAYASPTDGLVWVSYSNRNEISHKDIRPIAKDKSSIGVGFRFFSGQVSQTAFIESPVGEYSLEKSRDEQQASKRSYRVCPEFLPPPFIAFSIAILIVACGLYIQGLGWSASRKSYRGYFIVASGIGLMAFGWVGLFFGDWWSPIICTVKGAI